LAKERVRRVVKREERMLVDSARRWFALRVRPRTEKLVAEVLRGKGCEQFLPLCRQKRQWSDRVAEVDLPLFPGYVFSRFDPTERQPIVTIPAVIQVVGFGKVPHPVDDAEIDALQALVRSQLDLEPWPFTHVGQKVRITCGPLAGAEGMLEAIKSRNRLIVTVSLLQRSVAVEIPGDSAWPASPLEMPLYAA
jgi:transcription antitermination factor NusG